MRPTLYALSILAVMALAFWAYREGYETRESERAVRDLQGEIARAREDLAMLRAEWSYLNRPDRLQMLAEMNFERLELMPLRAEHYGDVDQVAFAPEPPAEAASWAGLDDKVSLGVLAPLMGQPTLADDGEQLP